MATTMLIIFCHNFLFANLLLRLIGYIQLRLTMSLYVNIQINNNGLSPYNYLNVYLKISLIHV